MSTESHTTLCQKQRVLIRGFAPSEEPRIAEILSASGYSTAQTIAGADLVVTGSDASERIVQLARERQIPVMPWSEIQERLKGTARQSQLTEPIRMPLVNHLGDRISILGTEIPCSARALDPGLFDGICFDEPFLRALRAAIRGAAYGFPTAFEGPTAASKTTVVIWLGRALGRTVTRLNLGGQSDTGELIGRYVPARQGDDWDLESLTACSEHLQPVTRTILERTFGQNLTWGQRTVIRCAEGIDSNQWRFQEGVIPQALRHGHFVLLDELNVAAPQILERINPVLESPPTLLLSEGDHTRFGPGSLPVHPGFRMFATLNPAEYSGRSVLSAAFRDRFMWFQAESPGEREYRQHLRFMVSGEQPEVQLDGRIYRAPASVPTLPRLADTQGIEGLLERLARFHAMLCRATLDEGNGQPCIGRSRRERYVFSRRGLIACLQLWDAARSNHPTHCPTEQLGQAIEAVYLDRLVAGDRKAARSIAVAAGLPSEAN